MNLRPLLLLIAAAVLTAEFGFIAWQRRELRELERGITARQAETRALAALERRASDLETSLRRTTESRAARTRGQPTPGSFADRFGTALKDPVFLQKLSRVQKQMISDHYGLLFDQLQLTPAQRERFTALLVEKQLAKTDAEAEANPMIGTGMMIPAIAAAQQDINAQIQQELGPAAYQAYYDFEMTDGLRTTVRRLQESLRYTAAPLADSQLEAVVAALDRVTPAGDRGGIAKFTGPSVEVATGLATQQFSAPLPEQTMAAAQSLLSAPQLEQLQQLMSQQRDELQLRSQTLAALHAAQPAP
jgi:hypothetical protein